MLEDNRHGVCVRVLQLFLVRRQSQRRWPSWSVDGDPDFGQSVKEYTLDSTLVERSLRRSLNDNVPG